MWRGFNYSVLDAIELCWWLFWSLPEDWGMDSIDQ